MDIKAVLPSLKAYPCGYYVGRLIIANHTQGIWGFNGGKILNTAGYTKKAWVGGSREKRNDIAGLHSQSETVWWQADTYQVPRIAFVNKMA